MSDQIALNERHNLTRKHSSDDWWSMSSANQPKSFMADPNKKDFQSRYLLKLRFDNLASVAKEAHARKQAYSDLVQGIQAREQEQDRSERALHEQELETKKQIAAL